MKALTDGQINDLNLKHGWFEYGDAQSAKTKAFVRDVEAMCAEKAKAELANATDYAKALSDELDKTRTNLADTRSILVPVFHILGIKSLGSLKSTVSALKAELEKAQKSNVKWYRIVERREKQLVELREAVDWYFECLAAYIWYMEGPRDETSCYYSWDASKELCKTFDHAEQQLREMMNG